MDSLSVLTTTPSPHGGEGEDEMNPWPFILLSVIIMLSITFDVCKEMVEHRVPHELEAIVEAFLSELATLGFIGALAFLLTYNFDSSCHGEVCTIMQQMSEHFLGEPMELQEIFEGLHFLLFFVSVLFILAVLVELKFSLSKSREWDAWEKALRSLRAHVKGADMHVLEKAAAMALDDNEFARALSDASAGEGENGESAADPLLGSPKRQSFHQSAWRKAQSFRGSVTRRTSQVQDQVSEKLLHLMNGPNLGWLHRPGTIMAEWFKPIEQDRAEYYRFRHRFIDDEEEVAETLMSVDFDFGLYLKLTLANTFAELIQIHVIDWVVMWFVFAVVFCLYAIEPTLTTVTFFICEMTLFFASIWLQAHLAWVRFQLLPDMHDMVAAIRSPQGQDEDGASMLRRPTRRQSQQQIGSAGSNSTAARNKQMSVRTGIEVNRPKYLQRGILGTSHASFTIIPKNSSLWTRFWKQVWVMLHGRTFNKHQMLFHFCSNGPTILMHVAKCCLFGSVVVAAVLATDMWSMLNEISPFLAVGAFIPPCITILMMPTTIQLYNIVTVIESMKNNEHIANVIKHQQNAKRKEAIRVLTLLQFFLDKADALANIDASSGAQMQNRDVDSAFEAMTKDAHSQHMVEELRTLFHTYDVDNSGQIDMEELGDLLATMGQPKSEEELSRLFNMMDADGSGDVDFKEFVTVIMHNRNCKHSLDTADIARRMWKLFDTDGDGTISPDEMLATFTRLGTNWNMDEVRDFLEGIDKDGNGTIDQEEFLEYVSECYGGGNVTGAPHAPGSNGGH